MNESTDLIDGFVRGRKALLRAADGVPASMRTTPFVGHWSLMDLLAHLVGWDYTNLNAIEELKAGATPAFYAQYDPGWASYNQQLIERYGADDWQALRAAIDQSQAAVAGMLRLLTEDELTRALATERRRQPITLANILRAAIADEREHLAQIQAFVGATGGTSA